MTSIELDAPAKVNLFLKVLNKRKDSYHNILTIFERIALNDRIRITKIPKGIIISTKIYITKNPRDNIAYKAAELILNSANIKYGVKIEIRKDIPIAAGLGGGSSDAASVLIGINSLYNLRYTKEDLMRLGRQLGADVPFFLLKAAFAIGHDRGDRLEVINSKARFWHLLIYPGLRVSTKDIYDGFDKRICLTKNIGDVKIQLPNFAAQNSILRMRRKEASEGPARLPAMDFGTIESMLHNDLEDTVKFKKVIVGRIIKRLAFHSGKKAVLSGSGPSLFCLYRTRREAIRDKRVFLKNSPARERKSWRVFIVKTAS